MSNAEELSKLADLHQRGVLSDDEFARAKERVLGGSGASQAGAAPGAEAVNTLRRSRNDRWLGGVCGGIAQVTGVASWIWRLMFTLLVLCAGTGFLFYILLWIFVPDE
ncbi:MAG: PspC domain-containing protein [Paucibacter sp.]|nr:PspC domain-containing protein [Roseateles sp.]